MTSQNMFLLISQALCWISKNDCIHWHKKFCRTKLDKPRSSEQLEWKAFSFFSISKQSDVSKNDSNIICTSTKKKQICQVWRAWLKKCPCHALEKFLMVKGMAASFFRLCLSNLVKSWNLMSTDTGENLVLISQTTFE